MSMPEQYPMNDLAADEFPTGELTVVALADEPLPEPKPALAHVAAVTALAELSHLPVPSRDAPAHRAE